MNVNRTSGFTLLEILMALFIVGILLASMITGLDRLARANQLREVAAAFAADLNRMRDAAIKRNITSTLVVNPTSRSYTVQVGTDPSQTVNLPNGFLVSGVTDNNGTWTATNTNQWTVAYQAPYGEIDATPSGFRFQRSANDGSPRVVRVVGVTGKVINGE